MIRQGNENDKVHVFTYVTEGTFDAYLYQLVQQKQTFISQIMTSKTPVRTMEDIDEKALEELNKKYSKYELAFAKEILTLITE